MPEPPPAPPVFYRPDEAAAILRCSAWWVKDQARRRRIPYCWIGGGYRFTPEHLAEIARRCEVQPAEPPQPAPRTRTATDPTATTGGAPALVARVPRRMRQTADVDPAA